MSADRGPSCQRGVTLIELIIAMLVITVGVLGLLAIYRQAVISSVDPLLRKQAVSLAEALMDEVLRAPHTACDKDDPKYDAVFRDPSDAAFPANPSQCSTTAGNVTNPLGAETVNGVADACPYDNVDDYNGFSRSGGAATCLGTVVPVGYTVAVAITRTTLGSATYGLIDGTAAGSATDGEALRIAVTVTGPDANSFTLAGYRARYAPKGLP